MTSLQPGGLAEVTITPRGRTSATLEGRWDDIYVTLINIKNDGRLVPYAQAPVDIADGRVRVEVFLRPANLAPKAPRKTRLSPTAWVRIRWALVAAVGAEAAVGVVLGAIALVQAMAALVAMWALPVEDPEVRAEAPAKAAGVRAERYYWWGGLSPNIGRLTI